MQRAVVAPPTVEELADELLTLCAYVVKTAQPTVLEAAAGLDLSISQLRALHVLEAADHDLALHELSARVGLSVATTGRAVDVLVREGLVSRREDGEDRRVKRHAITERGRDSVNLLIRVRREAMRRLADPLTDEERAALSDALAPLLGRPDVQAVKEGVSR